MFDSYYTYCLSVQVEDPKPPAPPVGALGDGVKQRELLEKILATQEALFGPNHLETAKALTNLGNEYGALCNAGK